MKDVYISLLLIAVLTACGQITPATNTEGMDIGDANNADTVIAEQPEQPEQEINSSGSGDLIPDGVLINTGSDNSVSLQDTNGNIISEIETPGSITLESDDIVIAGNIGPGEPLPPVIFHSWQPSQALTVNTNGNITIGRETNSFLSMVGAPGQAAFAFSEVQINAENYPHGFLYAAKPDNLESAASFYDLVDDPFYWALKPVGIAAITGEPQGVWYVKTAWGIGGVDLIFPIHRGLYFYNLTNGENIQYLDDNRNPQGISADLSIAASISSDTSGDLALSITDLQHNKTTSFPLDPATDRGAGWAVFSPDNAYVAWLEATGSMAADPFEFQPRIRVGAIHSGDVVHDVSAETARQVINSEIITMMRPTGWLDN